MMNLKSVGAIAVLGLLAGVAHADEADTCLAQCVEECLSTSTTVSTAVKCGKQCVQICRQNIAAPQNVFKGPVVSTPLNCSATVGEQCSGFAVSGTVANPTFCPGTVTFYTICPNGDGATTSIIGAAVVGADCSFSTTLGNQASGQTGCYGLIAVIPAPSGTTLPPNTSPDPGWSTCTGGACPSP